MQSFTKKIFWSYHLRGVKNPYFYHIFSGYSTLEWWEVAPTSFFFVVLWIHKTNFLVFRPLRYLSEKKPKVFCNTVKSHHFGKDFTIHGSDRSSKCWFSTAIFISKYFYEYSWYDSDTSEEVSTLVRLLKKNIFLKLVLLVNFIPKISIF